MKKILALLLGLLLLLGSAALAQDSEKRVFDNADLFTPEQEAQLEERIAAFRQDYPFDFVILTNKDSYSNSSAQDYADTYYEQNGFGVGDEHSGALFLIDLHDSAYCISTMGDAIDYVTDDRLDEFKSTIEGMLMKARSSGNYASAAAEALSLFQSYVKDGIPEGEYRYDLVTGQRLTERHKMLTVGELIFSLVISLVVGLFVFFTVRRTYHLKGSTYQYDYNQNATVKVTEKKDTFLRTDHLHTPRSQYRGGSGGHGNGAGVHFSSGGGSHGGGGGHF